MYRLFTATHRLNRLDGDLWELSSGLFSGSEVSFDDGALIAPEDSAARDYSLYGRVSGVVAVPKAVFEKLAIELRPDEVGHPDFRVEHRVAKIKKKPKSMELRDHARVVIPLMGYAVVDGDGQLRRPPPNRTSSAGDYSK